MNKDLERFAEAIDKNINYYRMEYKMNYAEVIGTLIIKVLDLYDESKEPEKPSIDDEEPTQ